LVYLPVHAEPTVSLKPNSLWIPRPGTETRKIISSSRKERQGEIHADLLNPKIIISRRGAMPANPPNEAAEAHLDPKNEVPGKEKKQKSAKRGEIKRSKNVDTFIHRHRIGVKLLN
jgi:hypothetical protein